MNKRRVEALEKIGASCKISSDMKQKSAQFSGTFDIKKEQTTVAKSTDSKDPHEDEITMWGQIVEEIYGKLTTPSYEKI